MKNMKKISGFIFIALLIISITGLSRKSYSQTLQFCENVTESGNPISSSTVFNIGSNGGYFKFLVNLPYRVGTRSVSYEIYKVDADGYESYDNTIYQDVEPSWAWFWKEVTFYSAGRYNVYVYDADKNFLASETVQIQFK